MSNINATASHIFRLLGWLTESPLTVEEINDKFEQAIGRKISSDSIWLYLNTLRALGCQISRPTPTNGFQHEMTVNAFSVHLTDSDLRILIETKNSLELHNASYHEQLAFDRFVKTMLAHASFLPEPGGLLSENPLGASAFNPVSSASPSTSQNSDEEFSLFQAAQSGRLLQDEYFTKTRAVDYDPHVSMIQTLERAILGQTGLLVAYRSKQGYPVSKFEITPPERLAYRHGVLYLVGLAAHTTVLTPWHGKSTQEDFWLRVERIEQVTLLSGTGSDADETQMLWQPVSWVSEPEDSWSFSESETVAQEALDIASSEFSEFSEIPLYEADFSQVSSRAQASAEQIIVRYEKAVALKLQPFHLRETMHWRKLQETGASDDWVLDVVFDTSDLFTLKQSLLEQGLPFRILSPAFFREDVAQLIEAMAQAYQPAH